MATYACHRVICQSAACGHGANRCLVAPKIYWQHVTFSIEDVVFVDDAACLVEGAVCFDDGRYALLVSQFTAPEVVSKTATRWELRRREFPYLLFLDGRYVTHAAMWDFEDELHVLILALSNKP